LTVPLNSVLTHVTAGADSAAISPLTELAYRYASALNGGLTDANVQAGIATVQNNFGVADIVHTMPVDALNLPGDATDEQKRYALALATISQYAFQQSAADLATALQSMSDCLVSHSTSCGGGPTKLGTLLGTALSTFTGGHTAFVGLSGVSTEVANFGTVTTVPGLGGSGPVGSMYTSPGMGGTVGGGYLELMSANGHVALDVTCNYGPAGDNEAFFFAMDPSVTPGSIQVTVAVDGQPSESFNDLGYNLGGQDRAFSTTGFQGTWPWHGIFTATEGSTVTRWDITVTGSSTSNCAALVYGGGTTGTTNQP
jgi:hypothetical protein